MKIKQILKWMAGILFLITGIVSLVSEPLISIVSILIGLFLIPPILEKIQDQINIQFSRGLKWLIVIGGLVLIGVLVSKQEASDDLKVDKIIEEASSLIDKGRLADARELIEKAKSQYHEKSNNKAIKLEKEMSLSRSEEFAKETLGEMTDHEFDLLIKNKLVKQYLTQPTLNKEFIEYLKTFKSQRENIVLEYKLAEITRKYEADKKERNAKIEKLFSEWDGSLPALTLLIKKNMNDPDSYEHVETKFRDEGGKIFVITRFRGKNAFGALIIQSVSAYADYEGNVLEIIE